MGKYLLAFMIVHVPFSACFMLYSVIDHFNSEKSKTRFWIISNSACMLDIRCKDVTLTHGFHLFSLDRDLMDLIVTVLPAKALHYIWRTPVLYEAFNYRPAEKMDMLKHNRFDFFSWQEYYLFILIFKWADAMNEFAWNKWHQFAQNTPKYPAISLRPSWYYEWGSDTGYKGKNMHIVHEDTAGWANSSLRDRTFCLLLLPQQLKQQQFLEGKTSMELVISLIPSQGKGH